MKLTNLLMLILFIAAVIIWFLIYTPIEERIQYREDTSATLDTQTPPITPCTDDCKG